jgi:hypothetical protein
LKTNGKKLIKRQVLQRMKFCNRIPNFKPQLDRSKRVIPQATVKERARKVETETKKRIVHMQAKETEDIPGNDDNLNNSVEDAIDPV